MLEAAREGVEPIREFDVFRDPGYTARADSKLGPDETKVVHTYTHIHMHTYAYIPSHILTIGYLHEHNHAHRETCRRNKFVENTNITTTT
jgi:hypothetical protein